MRYQSLRSVIRAAIGAGLVAACQTPELSASWKLAAHPFSRACFSHDLDWEGNRVPKTIEQVPLSPLTIDLERNSETKQCVAFAHQFELQEQVKAVMRVLETGAKQLVDRIGTALVGYPCARSQLLSIIDQQSIKLVEWIQIPDTLPVTTLAPDDLCRYDHECGWNCGDVVQDMPGSTANAAFSRSSDHEAVQLPDRDFANIFVFTFDTFDTFHAPETSSSLVNEGHFADGWGTNTFQVGIDPVCSELQQAEKDFRWGNSLGHPTICCPTICCPMSEVDPSEMVADSTHISSDSISSNILATRPPTLVGELEEPISATPPIESVVDFDWEYAPNVQRWIRRFQRHTLGHDWAPSFLEERFAFGEHSPLMPLVAPSIGLYSKKDLAHAVDIAEGIQQSLPAHMESIPSDPHADLETASRYSIWQPLTDSYRTAVDHAMRVFSGPVSSSRDQASKSIAIQLRSAGRFLVGIASQLDGQADGPESDGVEIARRPSGPVK